MSSKQTKCQSTKQIDISLIQLWLTFMNMSFNMEPMLVVALKIENLKYEN